MVVGLFHTCYLLSHKLSMMAEYAPSESLKRAKINLQTRRDQLRKKMTWLTSDVQVLNTQNYDYTLNGIAVHRMEK